MTAGAPTRRSSREIDRSENSIPSGVEDRQRPNLLGATPDAASHADATFCFDRAKAARQAYAQVRDWDPLRGFNPIVDEITPGFELRCSGFCRDLKPKR